MQCDEVVATASPGLLSIRAALEVDEALELPTSIPAERTGPSGENPEDSLHGAVADRLARYAEALKVLTADKKKQEPVAV